MSEEIQIKNDPTVGFLWTGTVFLIGLMFGRTMVRSRAERTAGLKAMQQATKDRKIENLLYK